MLTNRTSRRAIIGTGLGLGATAALTRAGLAQNASPAAAGEWSFTDDKGVTVTLPSRPQRVVIDVNAAAPLWDYGIVPTAVFGWLANPEGEFGAGGGRIDASQVEIIGNPEETIDVEALVGLNPDLVITLTFAPDDPLDYWSLAADGPLEQVQAIVPIIALSGVQAADVAVARFAELAAALGADMESETVMADLTRWEAAEVAFQSTLAEKPEITATFIAPAADMLYIANPEVAGDVMYFRELGLTIPDVVIDEANGTYWQYLSTEEIGAFNTDIYFSSYRGISIEEFTAIPTVATMPAVQAGQVFTWNQDVIMSYLGLAEIVEGVTEAIATSSIVTGE
jgi:iron complex transport system substrate-binding protein